MTITTYSGLTDAAPNSQEYTFVKTSIATQAAASLTSLWLAGTLPAAGAAPGTTWATCTKALTGTWNFANPGGSQLSYLSSLSCAGANAGMIYLYDRLGHMGGLSHAVGTAQTVTGSIPASRDASVDGRNVEWFFERYVATGQTAFTLTASYTRGSDDTAGRTSPAITVNGATPLEQPSRLYRILPIAGETIKSIQTVTLSATDATAGDFGITVAKRVACIPVLQATIPLALNFNEVGLPRIYDDACLWLVSWNSTTSTGAMQGTIEIVQG